MVIHNTLYAFFEGSCTEVYQQANWQVKQTKICKQLFKVDWVKGLNGLQLYNQAIFHQQIDSKPIIKMHAIKVELDCFLAFHFQATFFQ